MPTNFFKIRHRAANRNAIADAITTLQGRANYEGPELPVFLRVAPYEDNLLIDLCDPLWRVIQVNRTGWRICTRSPVAFVRTGATRQLPVPVPMRSGSIEPLWKLLNVTADQRPLVAGALLNFLNPWGPYFVVYYVGEQGSGKSCASRILRMLIDPNENPLRSPPREERDLLAQAASNWVIALENLSHLPDWLSDALCRLSTGGGHSARTLYTDLDEISLAVKRPVIVNGIEDAATRPDLAERALQLELETIPDDQRMTEKQLWAEFELARPIIFSCLLDGLVAALRDLPGLTLEQLPRMADAALWATAGESVFGFTHRAFITTYWRNIAEGAVAAVDASPVGIAIRQLLETQTKWTGEPAELLEKLCELASDEIRKANTWPKSPRILSGRLNRLAQALRQAGIGYEHFKSHGRRQITLCRVGNLASSSSSSSPPRENPLGRVALRTMRTLLRVTLGTMRTLFCSPCLKAKLEEQ